MSNTSMRNIVDNNLQLCIKSLLLFKKKRLDRAKIILNELRIAIEENNLCDDKIFRIEAKFNHQNESVSKKVGELLIAIKNCPLSYLSML